MGYVLGVLAASFIFGLVVLATTLRTAGAGSTTIVVVGAVLAAVLFALMSMMIAWLPFWIVLSLARSTALPKWSGRLAASLMAGVIIAPAFLVVDHALSAMPTDWGDDPDKMLGLLSTAIRSSLDVRWLAKDFPSLAPWMLGYALIAGLVYHAIVRGAARNPSAVESLFA